MLCNVKKRVSRQRTADDGAKMQDGRGWPQQTIVCFCMLGCIQICLPRKFMPALTDLCVQGSHQTAESQRNKFLVAKESESELYLFCCNNERPADTQTHAQAGVKSELRLGDLVRLSTESVFSN